MHANRVRFLKSFSASAGRLLESIRRKGPRVYAKGTRDVVTSADHAVESLLVRGLASHGFDDSVLSEESAPSAGSSGYRWILDPLDGTSNYSKGNPLYCSSAALEFRGKTIAGAVVIPRLGETFFAESGRGAFLNGKPIRVAKGGRLYNLVIGVERQPDARLVRKSYALELPFAVNNRVRTLGSVAIDLCFVACGRFDAFFSQSIYAWDCAAGELLVQEAGGSCTRIGAQAKGGHSGKPLGFAASNRAVHHALVSEIRFR